MCLHYKLSRPNYFAIININKWYREIRTAWRIWGWQLLLRKMWMCCSGVIRSCCQATRDLRGTSWDEGQDLDHLIFQREMRLARASPPLQRAAPGKQSRDRCSFPRGCQRTKHWQMTLVKTLSSWLYHICCCETNGNISFSKKEDPALALCWSFWIRAEKSWWSWKWPWQKKVF